MRLILLRHGHNPWSQEGRYTGSSDIELDDEGRRQADLVGSWFERQNLYKIDAMYTSPLVRCTETANMVASNLRMTPKVDSRLAEINYGHWEGKSRDEIQADPVEGPAYQRWESDPASIQAGEAESGGDVAKRYLSFVEQNHAEGKTVLAVTHRTVMRVAAAICVGMDLSGYRRAFDQHLCSINELKIGPDGRGMMIKHNFCAWRDVL